VGGGNDKYLSNNPVPMETQTVAVTVSRCNSRPGPGNVDVRSGCVIFPALRMQGGLPAEMDGGLSQAGGLKAPKARRKLSMGVDRCASA
jgi:hypothetical protein